MAQFQDWLRNLIQTSHFCTDIAWGTRQNRLHSIKRIMLSKSAGQAVIFHAISQFLFRHLYIETIAGDALTYDYKSFMNYLSVLDSNIRVEQPKALRNLIDSMAWGKNSVIEKLTIEMAPLFADIWNTELLMDVEWQSVLYIFDGVAVYTCFHNHVSFAVCACTGRRWMWFIFY